MAETAQTYLIFVWNDNLDHHPGLWVTKSDDLHGLVRKCGFNHSTIDIFVMLEQESYVKPEYVPWGGLKLKHVTRVEPTRGVSRALGLIRDYLAEVDHQTAHTITLNAINTLTDFLKERLTRPESPEADPQVEVIDLSSAEDTLERA